MFTFGVFLKVYLVRHGEASLNNDRHLTQKGKEEVNSVVKKLIDKKIKVDEIVHSGKERAKETCEILVNNILKGYKINSSTDLAPNSDVSIWGTTLNSEVGNYLLVGHLPFLSDLAYYLTGQSVEFGTADIVCLEKQGPSKWKFCWKLGP